MTKKRQRRQHHDAQQQHKSLDYILITGLTFLSIIFFSVTISTFINLPEHQLTNNSATPSPKKSSLSSSSSSSSSRDESTYSFPQSATTADQLEIIDHPSVLYQKNKLNKEEALQMVVPKFWNPESLGGTDGVRIHLGNHGKRLMTKKEAMSIGSHITIPTKDEDNKQNGTITLETIFVAIASYRDPQCPHTISSIFSRAKYPQRIRVGIIDQIEPGVDIPCSEPPPPASSCQSNNNNNHIMCRHQNQIDTHTLHPTLSVGPTFARHLGHRLYRGEYFTVQSDAHVSFTHHWDVDIISQWHQTHNEMAILTTYLSDVQGAIDPLTHQRTVKSRPIMCQSDYEGKGLDRHLRHGQQPEGVPRIHEPALEPYWAAGFSFGRGHFVVNIPYDAYLPMVFQGEEISMGLRGFTYGYDYYTPEKSVCFHMYAVKENTQIRHKVKLFWEHAYLYQGVSMEAMKRLNGIVGMNPEVPAEEWNHVEEERYGIGQVRTLQKFFDTYGIHVRQKTVEGHLCRFVGMKMQRRFVPNLRKNGMGIDYDQISFKFKDPAPNDP